MLLSLALCAPLQDAAPSDWTRFRGEEGSAVLPADAHPGSWSLEDNLAWSVAVPGIGWSSPLVIGDAVYVTSAIEPHRERPMDFSAGVADPSTFGTGVEAPEEPVRYQVRAYALADGELRWEKELLEQVAAHGVHPSNTYATESPATDGEHLYVLFAMPGLVASLDASGEERWRAELGSYPTEADFGTSSSLVVDDGRVYVQHDNEESSFVLALDASSGEEVWRAERAGGTSWASPMLIEAGGRKQFVALGDGEVTSYAPEDGSVLWSLSGIQGNFSASATWDGERLYAGNSGPMIRGVLLALDLGASGTHPLVREEGEAEPEGQTPLLWSHERMGPGFATPVVHDGLLYVLGGSMGILACHDAATGERLWRNRLPEGAAVVSSPWVVGDELFLLDETGKTFVVAVGPEFELLRTNTIEDLFWSTPSFAQGNLLLRGVDRMYCIRR